MLAVAAIAALWHSGNKQREFCQGLVKAAMDRAMSSCDLSLEAKRIEQDELRAGKWPDRPAPDIKPVVVRHPQAVAMADDIEIPDPLG